MLLPRVLTALVGLPVLLWLFHAGGLPYQAFVLGVTILSLYEYAALLWLGGRGVQRAVAVAGGGALAAVIVLGRSGGLWPAEGAAGLVLTAVVAAAVLSEMFRREHSLERAALTLFGVFFIGWTLPHLALLRDLRPDGERFTYLLFVMIWAMDSAAYFVGTAWGRTPLAPVLSPRKTWEGAAAGLAAALAVALAGRHFFMRDALSVAEAIVLGSGVGVVAQLSDLAKSLVKRSVGAKDSSSLLPGHGGVLDRFDSFLLAGPMMYYILAVRRP